MRKTLFLLLFTSKFAFSQVFIQTDLGNNIWGLPNLGVEYQFGDNALTINGLYKRKTLIPDWFFVKKMPSEGLSTNLNYKRFIGNLKQSFIGVSINYSNSLVLDIREYPQGTSNFYNYQFDLKNSHILVRPFVGFQTDRKKRFIGEFGIGGGLGNYYNKVKNIKIFEGKSILNNPVAEIKQISNKNLESSFPKKDFSLTPYISIKLMCRIGKKQL
jgi:hypothetical protein